MLDGAIEGQRDARSYTVVAKDKQHTMKPISSSTISSSKELKPNLPANGGPSCTTSSTMTTVTKSYVSASANNSLKDSEALYSDVHHLSTLQHKPLKDPSSTVGMQGDLNNIWKTAPITDQGTICHRATVLVLNWLVEIVTPINSCGNSSTLPVQCVSDC